MKQSDAIYVVQLFDRDGYYGCCVAPTIAGVLAQVERRSGRVRLSACSLPFRGHWSTNGLPEVSLPVDWYDTFAAFTSGTENEE